MSAPADSRGPATQTRLACGLVVLGVLSRLLPHPPNLTLTTALALFAGSACRSAWTVATPLVALLVSDVILGLHPLMPLTWGCAAATWLLGRRLGDRPSAGRVAITAVASSVLFFVATNFGVWLVAEGSTAYPKTAAGLWQCYVMALPFFRTAVLGDLIFSVGLFGLWELLTRPRPAAVPHPHTPNR